MDNMKILVINPGSTSTKIALYYNTEQQWKESIEHTPEELKKFDSIYAQLPMRYELVMKSMEDHGEKASELAAVMSRGGLIGPVPSGAFEVNEAMLDKLEHRPVNLHASNVGAGIAYKIAQENGIKAYIYDPVTVDEMIDVVRITGKKEIERRGKGHNLNMRAAALRYCSENKLDYNSANLIVAHLGGGITLSLHSQGRIADMALDDDGPFSPERAGCLPAYDLINLIFDRGWSRKQVFEELQRNGGLMSHFGVSDARKVEAMALEGDEYAKLVYEAMALGIAKGAGSLAVVVNGRVDAIILTGGIAYSKTFTGMITERVQFIAPVTVIPGENEMQALADGAYRVLTGAERARIYEEC